MIHTRLIQTVVLPKNSSSWIKKGKLVHGAANGFLLKIMMISCKDRPMIDLMSERELIETTNDDDGSRDMTYGHTDEKRGRG